MKRILKICSPQLGLNPNSYLGGEVHDHYIINGLAKRGHKIFVYLPKDRPYQKHKNIIVERTPIKSIPAFAFNLLVVPYLFRTYRKERFDILRVHNPYFVGLGAIIFKIFHPEVPIITTHHLMENSFLFDLINKLTSKKYDANITVSKFLKNWLVNSYGVSRHKIRVIYNGVDQKLKPAAKKEHLVKKYNLRNKFTIFFLGLLTDRKNPLFLLNVFAQLKSKYQNIALITSGGGPQEKELRSFVKDNKLTDVWFTGPIFGLEKLDHFNLCDVFALPSKKEGFGLVIAEAMACAKPVIASNNTSLKEIIDDKTDGFLAEIDNIGDWVSKIELLLQDNNLRNSVGQNALKKAKIKFNWQKISVKHEKLLLSLNAS